MRSNYIFQLAAFVAALSGPAYGIYFYASRQLVSDKIISKLSPLGSLCSGFMLAVLWSIVVAVPAVFFLFCLFGCAPPLGVILVGYAWFREVYAWWNLRDERWRYKQINPEPHLQIWLQDLLVLAFCFGCGMLLLRAEFAALKNAPSGSAVLIANLLLTQIAMFLAIMDALRRMPKPYSPRGRMIRLAGLLLSAALLPLFYIVLIGWMAWRRALWAERLGTTQKVISFR